MARNKDDYGAPTLHDPNFKGPLDKRSCTDILCFLIFFVFLAAWAFVGFVAFTQGDTSVILNPKDTDGYICGVDSNVIDKPYLVFFDIRQCFNPSVVVSGCPTRQVCVEKCPTDYFYIELINNNNYNQNDTICVYDANPTSYNLAKQYISQSKCAEWYLPTTSVLNRCIPTLVNLNETILSLLKINETQLESAVENIQLLSTAQEVSSNIINDYSITWKKILIGLGISVVVCIIYIALLRWVAGIMVWFSIIGVVVALGFSIYFTINAYNKYKNGAVEPSQNFLYDYISLKNIYLVLLIIECVVLAIILLILLALRNRIRLAITLVKESSKAVSSVTASLFFPIFPWIFQVGIILYGVIVALYLITVGDNYYELRNLDHNCICSGNATNYTSNGNKCEPNVFYENCRASQNDALCTTASCHFVKVENPTLVTYYQVINIVGIFWGAFFISAFSEMVLASTFATWYWTFKKSRVPFFTVTRSLYRTCRYHIGTLAFGSLIITICRIIRVILEYIDHKLKKFDNIITRAILCCMKCFFWCLEKFLKFINRNAYIMCAVYGKNFCTSARRAFGLLMRNILRVVVLDKVTDFLFFLSKLLLSAGVGCVAYFYFDMEKDNSLNYLLVPVLTIAAGTYFIATIFFTVFTMAVDTIFLCFLEDCERNDGTMEKPYYMSKQLMTIFGKRNKIQ